MDGNVGEISHLTMKYFCICRANYKRIEATSNWVTSEEGLFKMLQVLLGTLGMLPRKRLVNISATQPGTGSGFTPMLHSAHDAGYRGGLSRYIHDLSL